MKRMACITLGLALGHALGCGPAVDAGSGTDTDEGDRSSSSTGGGAEVSTATPTSATTTPGSSTSTTTTTGPTSTTVPTATDPTIGPDESSSGSSDSSSSGFISSSSSSSDSGNPDGLPDGSDCTLDSQCASDSCYVTGIGGICGECSSDADCDFGCSLPNPLASPPEGSMCNDGNLGDGCESDDACPGLQCVNIIDVPGILEANTCSECEVDADCTPGLVCDISVDVANITGLRTCVPPGSVGLGEFCAEDGSGDQACGSGACATASLKGLLEFGVCSECENNTDCMPGETCFEPEVGLDGSVTPGFCG